MENKAEIKAKALEFLRGQQVAVVSTVSESGEPQSAAVTFLVDDEFNILFITRKNTRKFANMTRNPKVAVVVGFDPEHPSTIQMHGTAKISEENRISTLLKFTKALVHRDNWWPLLKVAGLDFVVMEVRIDWARWLNLDAAAYDENFKENFVEIIP